MEIPALLGTGKENWSDWAAPCFPYGGNEDSGMFWFQRKVPPSGPSLRVVTHSIQSGLASGWPGQIQGNSRRKPSGYATTRPAWIVRISRTTPRTRMMDRSIPSFMVTPPYYCPRRRVLFKSETGHTIVADDRDQEESFKFIDRGGQILHMRCPVRRPAQAGNTMARGVRDAEQGDQLDIDKDIHEQSAGIEITDLCRQSLHFEAVADKEKIHILSCDKTRGRWQKILLDTTEKEEKVHIFGFAGLQHFTIDSSQGKEKIIIQDRAGSAIIMDGLTGNIVLKPTNMLIM